MSPSASSILYRTANGIAIAAVLAIMPPAASADPEQQKTAAEDAKKFGAEQQKQQFNSATMLTPSTLANMPTSTRPDATKQSPTTQRGLFQGGQGAAALINAATTASTECSKDKSTLDCQAANLQAGQVSTSSATADIKSSPMYANDKSIFKGTRDATTAGGILSSYVGGSQSVCSTDTISTPAVFEKETCIEYANPAEQKCTVGQTVVVDPDYLYECKIRTNKDVGQGCGVGQKVVVDQDYLYQCIQRNASDIGKNCTVGKEIIVDPDYKYQCETRLRSEVRQQCNSFLAVACEPQPTPPCADVEVIGPIDAEHTLAVNRPTARTVIADASFNSTVISTQLSGKQMIGTTNSSSITIRVPQGVIVTSSVITSSGGNRFMLGSTQIFRGGDFADKLQSGDNIVKWWGAYGGWSMGSRHWLPLSLTITYLPYCPSAPPPICKDSWDTTQCDTLSSRVKP